LEDRREARERATLIVICIESGDYPASLEQWRVYRVVPDTVAKEHGLIRVIDETGEDYLFSKDLSQPIELQQNVRRLYRPPA
jgi:hypothetical protein